MISLFIIALIILGFWGTNKHIKRLGDKIMTTQAEMTAQLADLKTQVLKVDEEIRTGRTELDTAKAKIVELQAIIDAGGEITPELLTAFQELKDAVQRADDELPDAVPAPEPAP